MVPIRCDFGEMRRTKPGEYLSRFLFGCAVTLVASLVAKWAGPVIGGLFLAFPGIFPPSISLVEKKEIERKREAGVAGKERGCVLASVHAAGASEGAFGLMSFAAVVWLGLPRFGPVPTMLAATAAWFVVAFAAWWVRERL